MISPHDGWAPARHVLVLGIGNTLLGDEGLGIVCLDRLRRVLAATALADGRLSLLDGGTLSFTLAASIADCDALLVLDAAELGGPPGHVQRWEGDAMDAFVGAHRKRSVHEVGLVDLMSISRLGEHWPARRALIGMQPEFIGWSDSLSAPVENGMPTMVALAREQLLTWMGRSPV